MLVEEGAQLAFGLGAHETVHGTAAHHQHAGRHRADAEHASELLLLVGIDLGQLETAGVVDLELVQQRAQGLAWAAPGRPEVHQHGHFHRGGNHLGFKIFYRDIDHGAKPFDGLVDKGKVKSRVPLWTAAVQPPRLT
ncbi:hypothetical protein D3C85_1442560 [compost metagenome]